MLPPEILARIGKHLDAPSRTACVLAAKSLCAVHESRTEHELKFEQNAEKMVHISRIVAFLLQLMPRLATLTVAFTNIANDSTNVVACALFREQMRALVAKGVVVSLKFDGAIISPSFMRRVVWDIASVPVTVTLPAGTASALAMDVLDVCDHTAELRSCDTAMFNALPSSMLDRLRKVVVTLFPPMVERVLDLSRVNPVHTSVLLQGFDSECTVLHAHKLSRVWLERCIRPCPLISSLLEVPPAGEERHIQALYCNNICSTTVSMFCAIAEAMPKTAHYIVSVIDHDTLPFLERLAKLGVRVSLYGGSDQAHRAARMVQLMTKFPFPIIRQTNVKIDKLSTVTGVFNAMNEREQQTWFMAKYM